jgi:hypothetical protein
MIKNIKFKKNVDSFGKTDKNFGKYIGINRQEDNSENNYSKIEMKLLQVNL